jgi:co-chaperonin GroES (HSP10)
MIKLQEGYIMAEIKVIKPKKKNDLVQAELFVHKTKTDKVKKGDELILTERATGTKVAEGKKDYFITHISNVCATK